VKDFHLLSFAS